ncbi:hypothetical protein B566_EDAN012905 [Ephemera danica]|nr:hypothetical protein B566_EDAN012905 [Ephemera danica]
MFRLSCWTVSHHQWHYENHFTDISRLLYFNNSGANFTGKTPDGKFVAKKQYIISGMLSYRGQFPFIAGLDIDDDFFCGGSLITRIHVLTAAHCCSDSKKYDVYLGAQNIDADEAGRTLMTSYRKVFHHQFNPDSLVNDIAIVFLPKAATLTKKPEVSDVMYNIELNIVPLAECMKTYGSDSVFNTNICSASRGIQATCQGDSGGPLVIRDSNNQWMQVGLVSYGAASGCEEGYPDVFTRLTPFLPWIKKTVSVPFVGMSNGALKKKPNRAFNPSKKIVNGASAVRTQFPHQAAMILDSDAFCGGSIISVKHILTAAHCAEGVKSFDVTLGAQNMEIDEDGRINMVTTSSLIHPRWDTNLVKNDISLIYLPRAITYNAYIQPIRLPRVRSWKRTLVDMRGAISGFGRTSDG